MSRSRLARLLPALAVLASVAAPLQTQPTLAATTDVVNVPGPNSTLQQIPVGPDGFSTSVLQQTFTPQQTGNLVGVWIAAACSCGPEPNSFVNLHVSTATHDELLDPPLATWAGGNSGNLQYVPLNGSLPVTAGETVNVTFGCSPYSPGCLSSFSLVATGDQYAGGALARMSIANGDTFSGTGISYISERSLDEGSVDVYLDGVYQGAVNAYAAGVHNQGGRSCSARPGSALASTR